MTDEPWRVADLRFKPFDEPGSNRQLERATIDGIEIFREGGRYRINSAKGQLLNASEKEADAHLSWLSGEVGNRLNPAGISGQRA